MKDFSLTAIVFNTHTKPASLPTVSASFCHTNSPPPPSLTGHRRHHQHQFSSSSSSSSVVELLSWQRRRHSKSQHKFSTNKHHPDEIMAKGFCDIQLTWWFATPTWPCCSFGHYPFWCCLYSFRRYRRHLWRFSWYPSSLWCFLSSSRCRLLNFRSHINRRVEWTIFYKVVEISS